MLTKRIGPVGLVFCLLSMSGCSLLFGNIKPPEEKSTAYGIADLSVRNSEWSRLDPKTTGDKSDTADPDTSAPESGVSDMVLQSKKTASIVSINSACKHYGEPKSLKELTRELLLGISDVAFKNEKNMTVGGTAALETTVEGKIREEKMTLRTVVLQKSGCVYDLMYVARPDKFSENEEDFSIFVSSLRLR